MSYKSVYIAYILLFIGGFFGLHLLYLRRDSQAFLYWCSLGGYCGLGPIRDLFRLHSYVKDCNNDPGYTAELARKVIKYKKPPLSYSRLTAQIVIGNSWSYLWIAAIPDEELFGISLKYLKYFGPLASALGVWLIGNIGREVGSLKLSILGAYLIFPLVLYDETFISLSSITSALLFQWKARKWRRTPYVEHSFCRRFALLSIGWFIFSSIFSIYILFNAEVSYGSSGEKVKLKDAIINFFKSPMFLEFKKNFWKLIEDIKIYGWSEALKNLIELLDPLGEHHALKVLNLPKNSTQEEISATFKKLSKEWHPDKHTNAEKKQEAHAKFLEINAAYGTLSDIKKRRNKKNKKFAEDDYNVINVPL